MAKKIIVAGGGHGGIAAAALLSKKGFDVTVYERNSRDNMGYDWTDIFAPKSLSQIGIEMPDKSKYEYKTDMTFYGPGEHRGIRQRVPAEELEIKMERSDIYDMLISHAEKCGVKFCFEHNVLAPVAVGSRVLGIKTDKGDFYADLVIDACGCESPVRANLPDSCIIQKHTSEFEKFYVYRAFYNKASDCDDFDKYKVCLLPEGKLGIGWVATEEEYTDLLIGRFAPFDMNEVNRTAEYFRSKNPSLGNEVKRGGQFVEIPVRQPLAVLVADGYAAIGDSAFMTVPIIGSGLANSFKAARMLADTVINDDTCAYSAETLWQYQRSYYSSLGNGLAVLAQVKLLLTKITPDELDYLLDNNILSWRELTITAESTDITKMIHLSSDLPARGLSLVKNKKLTQKLINLVADIASTVVVTAQMPKRYNYYEVKKWADKYNKNFT